MEVNNRYMAHSTSAENYVYLSGASGNYMSVADNPPLDVTGDIDIQVKVAMDDWTPASTQTLINKATAVSTQFSYQFNLGTTGGLQIFASLDGINLITATSVATGFSDGSTGWVRFTRASSNGDVKFFTSSDGTTWTQLGTTQSTTAGSLYAGTAIVEIGSRYVGTSNNAKTKVFRAIIKNGIDGTIVLDADASVITLPSQTTFVDRSSNAYTVTINKSGVGTFVSTGNYLYLPGIASNYASAPDAAPLDIVGDIDLRCKVALDDWTPSAVQYLISKANSATNRSYVLNVQINGTLSFSWTTDGINFINTASTVAPTVADGATLWVRATLSVASNYAVIFYTSPDGTTWTQLGTTVTGTGATSIFSGTSILEVGSLAATNNARGKFFRAQVLNGINGTVAFDANFENSITSLNQASFTESSTNGATVTINRSGSTFRSAGVIDAGYLYPGATNTFSNSTTDFLNFGATDSYTILAVARRWNTQAYQLVFSKKLNDGVGNPGYSIFADTSNRAGMQQSDGTNTQSLFTGSSYLSGSETSLFAIRNVATDTITFASDTTISANDITTGSLSSISTLVIGRQSTGNYADMEFVGAAVFRQVLTAAQIRQVSNYFANREVYL
jgi:hypothetical protein